MADTNLFYLLVDVGIMGSIVGLTALLVIWFMWRYQKGKTGGNMILPGPIPTPSKWLSGVFPSLPSAFCPILR